MEQYISKSTIAAEIKRLKDELQEIVETSDFIAGEVFIMNYFISFLDTIKVREVDLKKEIDDTFLENKCNITDNVSLAEFARIARYFFELGLKAKGE